MDTYLIHEGSNPTSDFYFPARNRSRDIYLFENPNKYKFKSEDQLIFIRYINYSWRRYLSSLHRADRPEIIFFIDDDVFDRSSHKILPWRYQWKLYNQSVRHEKWLREQGAKLWVSTACLGLKYADWCSLQIIPKNPYLDMRERKSIIFYHGSASHQIELEWLIPVIEKVVTKNENIVFEIIGNKKIKNMFNHIEEVSVVHPMSWDSYRHFISRPGRSIGLAPLLESSFNDARAATKYFDITQAGAVGIYADMPPYQKYIRHMENGLLLSMKSDLWADQILWLADNPELQSKLK